LTEGESDLVRLRTHSLTCKEKIRMGHEFGEILFLSLEVLAGVVLLWFIWSIGSDIWHLLRRNEWIGD
jgi:hypothetical protein